MTSLAGVLDGPCAITEAGDKDEDSALEDLYARFGPVVFRRCCLLLGDRTEAEDLLQDVFVRLAERRHQFRGESDILTFIYRIATNLCLNRLRYERHRHPKAIAKAPEPQVFEGPAIEGRLTIARLFEALEPRDVQIAVFAYFDGMTQPEIAEVLGLSDRTIRKRMRHIELVARQLIGPIEEWGRAEP